MGVVLMARGSKKDVKAAPKSPATPPAEPDAAPAASDPPTQNTTLYFSDVDKLHRVKRNKRYGSIAVTFRKLFGPALDSLVKKMQEDEDKAAESDGTQ